jgi:glycosyltransferase involved in cell wall biosynthesis
LLGSIFERCAWVTAVSERLLEDVHALAPGTRGKSSCIYNGRALPELPEDQVRPQTVVLGCGRQVEDKGFDVLIAAFARLAARVPEATLVLAGDGPERPHLEQQARTLGVLDRVTFPGWLSEIALQQQMARSTILVVPSRWREGCALVVLEAAMQGLPVLASNVGSLPELIDPERTGVLVPPEDASALSEALVSLLQSPERRRRMAAAARAAAWERFSLPRMIDQYEAIYEQLVPPTASLAESRLSYAASL